MLCSLLGTSLSCGWPAPWIHTHRRSSVGSRWYQILLGACRSQDHQKFPTSGKMQQLNKITSEQGEIRHNLSTTKKVELGIEANRYEKDMWIRCSQAAWRLQRNSSFKGIQLLGCGTHGRSWVAWIWDLYTHSHALTDP